MRDRESTHTRGRGSPASRAASAWPGRPPAMSRPRYVRLIRVSGALDELEGRYLGSIDVVSLERWVSPGVARVLGTMSMAGFVRLPDDPDGTPLFRELPCPALVE